MPKHQRILHIRCHYHYCIYLQHLRNFWCVIITRRKVSCLYMVIFNSICYIFNVRYIGNIKHIEFILWRLGIWNQWLYHFILVGNGVRRSNLFITCRISIWIIWQDRIWSTQISIFSRDSFDVGVWVWYYPHIIDVNQIP